MWWGLRFTPPVCLPPPERRFYFTSTVAPTSSSFFFMSAASAFAIFSFTGLGAPSTRSLASLRPRPVSSRTTLITWIFLSPAADRTTSNSVCSSAGAAAAPPAAGAATATAAAADTPHFSCSIFESWDASRRVSESSFSTISSILAAMSDGLLLGLFVVGSFAPGLQHSHELALRSGQERHDLAHRSLQGADELSAES